MLNCIETTEADSIHCIDTNEIDKESPNARSPEEYLVYYLEKNETTTKEAAGQEEQPEDEDDKEKTDGEQVTIDEDLADDLLEQGYAVRVTPYGGRFKVRRSICFFRWEHLA